MLINNNNDDMCPVSNPSQIYMVDFVMVYKENSFKSSSVVTISVLTIIFI